MVVFSFVCEGLLPFWRLNFIMIDLCRVRGREVEEERRGEGGREGWLRRRNLCRLSDPLNGKYGLIWGSIGVVKRVRRRSLIRLNESGGNAKKSE